MKINIRKTAFIGLIIFLLMQLYQPARNENYEPVSAANFTSVYTVPENIKTVLSTSCYDCHSNNTNYPWYSSVQPARFFMESHIKEGKENLNFDEFGSYSKRKQRSKLESMVEQIEENKMPLKSYILMHKKAKLTARQKKEVMDWISKVNDSLAT